MFHGTAHVILGSVDHCRLHVLPLALPYFETLGILLSACWSPVLAATLGPYVLTWAAVVFDPKRRMNTRRWRRVGTSSALGAGARGDM